MADGINLLQQVVALQAQEASDSGQVPAPPAPPPTQQGPEAQPVITLVDDLVRAARTDGKGHAGVDAAIEKFCDEHYKLNPAQGERVEALLKMAVHTAQQGGLTRGEAVAAVSQVGQSINNSPALSAEAYVEAAKVVGTESHLAMGVARFLVEMDGGNPVQPAAAATARMESDVSARYNSTLYQVGQNWK